MKEIIGKHSECVFLISKVSTQTESHILISICHNQNNLGLDKLHSHKHGFLKENCTPALMLQHNAFMCSMRLSESKRRLYVHIVLNPCFCNKDAIYFP
jgi:hypothetical protein